MNILVAEDEAIALKRSKYFLEKWGHSVTTVQNGLEALEEFLATLPAVERMSEASAF